MGFIARVLPLFVLTTGHPAISRADTVDEACTNHPQSAEIDKSSGKTIRDDAIVALVWRWSDWGKRSDGKHGPIAEAPVYMVTPSIGVYPDASTREAVVKRLSYLKPFLPFHPPARAPGVFNVEGWNYQFEPSFHNALDIAYPILNKHTKEYDDTFPVLSVADGTVVWVGFQPGSGNTVIVEHVSEGGTVYHSFYDHLRDGRDNDIKKTLWYRDIADLPAGWKKKKEEAACADAILKNKSDRAARCCPKKNPTLNVNYCQGTDLKSKSEILKEVERQWGTNANTIRVRRGQRVRAWQPLADAGMVGSSMKGNHLHFMIGVVIGDDRNRSVLFDPYGNYGAGGYKGPCYKLPIDTSKPFPYDDHPMSRMGSAIGGKVHPKFFAPIFSTFVRTSFRGMVDGNKYFGQFGMYPGSISVGRNAAGARRFSGYFKKFGAGKQGAFLSGLDSSAMKKKLTDFVSDPDHFYNVRRVVTIVEDGKPSHTALWLKQKRPPADSTAADLLAKTRHVARIDKAWPAMEAAISNLVSKGYTPIHFDAYTVPSGGGEQTHFNAVFKPEKVKFKLKIGLSLDQVQERNEAYAKEGMQLKRVVLVRDRYSALWVHTGAIGRLVRVKEREIYDRRDEYLSSGWAIQDIQHSPLSGVAWYLIVLRKE